MVLHHIFHSFKHNDERKLAHNLCDYGLIPFLSVVKDTLIFCRWIIKLMQIIYLKKLQTVSQENLFFI